MDISPLIAARQLSIGYRHTKAGQKIVHCGLSFNLQPGELTCLLGPNGAGKSTLLRTLAAFQPFLEGELLFEGRPLTAFSEREKSRKIGVVLTDKTQAGGLKVYELVALGRQPHTGFWGRLDEKDHQLIREAMEAVGITHKAGNYMAELSDGERQKVMIAKALVQECPLILLDEPTAFLDVASRIEIMTLLHSIVRQQGKTILLSTHDIEQALILADRLWLLSPEVGLQCGVTEDLIFQGALDRLFDRDKIHFDRANGIYSPVVQDCRKVILTAAGPILRHWCMNALHRYHYQGLTEDSGSAEYPELRVESPQEIYWIEGDSSRKLGSFGELAKLLNSFG